MPAKVATVAALLADSSRTAMLTHLLDGRYHAAGELAGVAGITAQTASFHLAKMSESGLVIAERHGRHRYYRIGDSVAAEIIEQLLSAAGADSTNITSLKQSEQMKKLSQARICYDHLAGNIAVQMIRSLEERNIVVKVDMRYDVTANGDLFSKKMGLDLDILRKKRRTFARCCLDWTEREHHLAGSLGQALTEWMLEKEWIIRDGATRAVYVTEAGARGIAAMFPSMKKENESF
ncbi:ArsR/SmtB family transcription factor [Paenibacillus sp. 481]|uniref:ArsR/SmtB family transcription factor n=1 Tax=Paenibacillus sp. 481 TaxID=2835869 RepID=UPI001E55A99F|nr:metalloregulator ArsR/SmtB family transcription factor [Paenibacillus sp. 481]UHA75862.1 helix-turn-helix transcriptional regulator [Paenibacillus sp. 481]